MTVTIQRWKYNNDWMRIDKYSERISFDVVGDCAADCMEEINQMRQCSNLKKFSPWEIVNIQD